MNSMRSSNNGQMMQQQPMGEDPSIVGRPLDLMSNNNTTNQQMLQPPPNTTLSMTPFPGLTAMGGGDPQLGGPGSTPLPAPPRCQIMNPFLGTPPLVPHVDRMQQPQQPTIGGSSIGQMESTFTPDMRHRGYPGVLNLPPPFQVHPNLQSQIQAFQHDMGQQQQPPGFLQGFIPAEIVSSMPESRSSSHLLQPHVRQRARRRSRANRSSSIIHHVHEAPPALVGGNEGGGGGDVTSTVALSRSREMPPTAQVTMDSAFGDSNSATIATTTTVVTAVGATTRLEDAKLKGLEENYSSIGENFECNICFQKANEAVVTCCGHLFCWPCLYRWLHIHSYHKECPVCKGAIDESTITPIYGRECNALLSARGLSGGSTTERIPPRPPARRVESARQLREREDRGQEREQRERALEREREREREQQSESQGLAEVLVGQPPGVGIVTTSIAAITSIEEGGMMRDSTSSGIQSVQRQVDGGGRGVEITISNSGERQHQQEEIDSMESMGYEDTSSSGGSMSQSTQPPGVMNIATPPFQDPISTRGSLGGGRATSPIQLQGLATAIVRGGGSNSPSTNTNNTPTFLQRRVSDRREQLRAALEASARSGVVNSMSSTLAERVDERRQMIAAATLLSQEWEDIMNISRLVGPMNPVHATAWIAAVQGSSMDGTNSESMGGFLSHPHHHQQQQHVGGGGGGGGGMMLHSQPIHRSNVSSRHMIASPIMISQDGGSRGEDLALSHLVTVNPLQAGEWLAAMRSRLTSMEKIVENLDSPLQVLQQPIPMSLHLNLPSAQSSISNGGHLLQTSSSTPSPGLDELSLLDGSMSTATSMQGPSRRTVEERSVVATTDCEAPQSSTPPASSSSTSTSTPVQSNTRTHSEPRLHYREASVPKPPNSGRRRSSRTSEEGTSTIHNNNNNNQGQSVTIGGQHDETTEGSRYIGPPEPMASNRSKRRRLDN
ncbi:unnamed protein product [Calypogeia fissa]